MRLTFWGHSCVRVEHPGGRVVVDPGGWSDVAGALAGATAVLVTHEHADHVAVQAVVGALAQAPDLRVWAPAPVVALLAAAGAPVDRLSTVLGGDTLDLDGLEAVVVGERHALIHPDVPRVANVGYLLAGVYHPGDSLEAPGSAVDVLLAPIGAPWLKIGETVELVRQVRPRTVVPIHDAVLSDAGRGLADRLVGGLGGAAYRRLGLGEGLDLG